MEDLCDMKWNIIGYSLLLIYHFSILVIFAVVSSNSITVGEQNKIFLFPNIHSQVK